MQIFMFLFRGHYVLGKLFSDSPHWPHVGFQCTVMRLIFLQTYEFSWLIPVQVADGFPIKILKEIIIALHYVLALSF